MEAAAVRLLAAREHSRAELERKLATKGHQEDAFGPVLDDLEQRGLLSDQRFAEQYVAQRVRKGYGPLRIRAELRERGVSSELIAEALDHGDHDWPGLLRDVRAGRFGKGFPADRRDAVRQARFLAQRGFPESLVRHEVLDLPFSGAD